MSQFHVSPEELRGHAQQLQAHADNAQGGFDSLRADLADLESSFRGQAATRYNELMEEWQTSAASLAAALAALGAVLSDEALATEELDAEMAGSA